MSRTRKAVAAGVLLTLAMPLAACTRTAEAPDASTPAPLTAVLPDGSVRPLLWLRELRSDWPSPYVYVDPVPLPRGARLVMTTYVENTGDAAFTSRPRLHLTRVPAAATTF